MDSEFLWIQEADLVPLLEWLIVPHRNKPGHTQQPRGYPGYSGPWHLALEVEYGLYSQDV